ncbi:MAG: DUF1501 domain-containing protein [Pseudomonadota bacterium]
MSDSNKSAPPAPPSFQRRRMLGLAGGGVLASAFGVGQLGSLLLAPGAAMAAEPDYKALVCLFLHGGNDGMNTVVPTDSARYAQYAGVRGSLALPKSSLIALTGTDYGLHPAMSALSAAWADGALAPLFNVGPLFSPLSKAQYRAANATDPIIPASLFSHSDQSALWETATTSTLTSTGWGGRASQVLATVNPVIALSNGGRFGLSSKSAALGLPGPGSGFGLEGFGASDLAWAPVAAGKAALDAMYAEPQSNVLTEAFARMHRESADISGRLEPLVKIKPGSPQANAAIDKAFGALTADGELVTPLARQLYQIAKLIAGNATVKGNRQIFLAGMGGFDTHGGQIDATVLQGNHAELLKQVGDASAAFYQAMKALGMSEQVTLFTQSDFGRTFKPNNSKGTDHAWGNHHVILGGAVKGRTTYGVYPSLELGGADDVGVNEWEKQGRWIPTSSVDQYAATLLQWFGASGTELDAILPNLGNFGSRRALGFL